MAQRKLDILVLFDVPYAPPNDRDFSEFMQGDDWTDERHVIRALQKLGHRVATFGVFDDIAPLVARLHETPPDVVFNMCETFDASRAHEPNLMALLELLKVPYTGAGPEALSICKDKGLTKKILSWHDVRVPGFVVSPRGRPLKRLGSAIEFPALCKPLDRDGSEGLAQASLVRSEEDGLARVHYIHAKLGADAIIEEYVEGRELYVGVLGNERLTVLPPTELRFKRLPAGTARFLTYKAKWDEKYRRRYGIDSDRARALEPRTEQRLVEVCKEIYRALKLSGYARVDLRLAEDGEPVIIEVNPNPSIKRTDDFAWAAKAAGINYEELLARILQLALAG